MQNVRCFVAINLPDNIKEAIEKEKQEIIRQFPENSGLLAFNWVKKENLHITLLFLGEVKTEVLPKIIEKLKEMVGGAGELVIKINRVCYGLKQAGLPRLIWLETEANKALNQLNEKIADGLSAFCQASSKGFIGHITLARVKAWQFSKIEPEEIPEIDKALDLSFSANTVDLMQSNLSRSGPTYTILQNINIK